MKTEPFAHQRELFNQHKDEKSFALFWEMGLGKSKVLIDIADHLYRSGKIEAVLILAPNSVFSNWINHELPKHMSSRYFGYMFRSKEKKLEHVVKRQMFLNPKTGELIGKLRVAAMSYDGLCTDHGFEFAKKFVILYKTMIIADESTAIKSGKARRSKQAKAIARHCHYRWIATGTPVAQSPFDIHSQIEFIDEHFWANHGLKSIVAFRNRFGNFQTMRMGRNLVPQLTSYRDLDHLNQMMIPISSRLLKEDSEVVLPPKLYSVRSFELTDKQRSIYDKLVNELHADIAKDPESFVQAPLAITRLMRLHQITSGFVTATTNTYEPIEGDDELFSLTSRSAQTAVVPIYDNPRLHALMSIIEECSHKVVVWCRFSYDVDAICSILVDSAVRYDGTVSFKERESALSRFADPRGPKVFVANTHAISMGVTLNIAKTAVYYSNSYSLEKRLQSEDRIHRIGQDVNVQIIDLVAIGTVDEKIVDALKNKFEIAAAVTGDRVREWLNV